MTQLNALALAMIAIHEIQRPGAKRGQVDTISPGTSFEAKDEEQFEHLRAAGLPLHETLALPDHYDFNSWPRASHLRETLICTEKDAIKLWRQRPDALAVPLRLDVPPAFFDALDQRLAARGYHPRMHAAP